MVASTYLCLHSFIANQVDENYYYEKDITDYAILHHTNNNHSATIIILKVRLFFFFEPKKILSNQRKSLTTEIEKIVTEARLAEHKQQQR